MDRVEFVQWSATEEGKEDIAAMKEPLVDVRQAHISNVRLVFYNITTPGEGHVNRSTKMTSHEGCMLLNVGGNYTMSPPRMPISIEPSYFA